MKPLRKQYIPALRAGRFYGSFHDVKEGFILRTASMLIQSTIYHYFAQHSQSIDWIHPEEPVQRSDQLIITWIGHSTFLIQIGGINILTDPIFGNATFLYQRIVPPGLSIEQLPPIDVILISHNHPDHMHAASLHQISKRFDALTILVPYGDREWFDSRGYNNVHEHSWWDDQDLTINGKRIRFTFLPAAHWTQRGIFDRNRSLWGSWMIQVNDSCIYFAGDSAYGTHFSHIGREFRNIDVGIMPIGPCEPRKMMKDAHMDAAEACNAFIELDADQFIPMHWGTFYFGHEPHDLPILRLRQWWQDNEQYTKNKKLWLPKIGQKIPFR